MITLQAVEVLRIKSFKLLPLNTAYILYRLYFPPF